MIRPELELVMNAVDEAMRAAGLSADEVDRVLVTGGSAQLPAFHRELVAMFGAERLVQCDAFTAVVHGLGVRAQELWAGR